LRPILECGTRGLSSWQGSGGIGVSVIVVAAGLCADSRVLRSDCGRLGGSLDSMHSMSGLLKSKKHPETVELASISPIVDVQLSGGISCGQDAGSSTSG
jgi:hypothetical protein